jgi:hypothetical protein
MQAQCTVSVSNETLALCNMRIQVIRSATQVLAMTSIKNNTTVEVSRHRQDMGECDTDVGLNSAEAHDKW